MTRTRPLLAAATAVLVGGLGFAAGSLTAADAESKPVTAKQVKKIAAKQIKKAAPKLSVAHAGTADSAGTAAKVGSAEVRTFGLDVANDGPGATLAELSGVRLVATCPAGKPTVTAFTVVSGSPGSLRYYFYGDTSGASGGGNANIGDNGFGNLATGNFGSSVLDYRPAVGRGMSASFGWGSGTACSFYGSAVGS